MLLLICKEQLLTPSPAQVETLSQPITVFSDRETDAQVKQMLCYLWYLSFDHFYSFKHKTSQGPLPGSTKNEITEGSVLIIRARSSLL